MNLYGEHQLADDDDPLSQHGRGLCFDASLDRRLWKQYMTSHHAKFYENLQSAITTLTIQ